jgi:hypothetical protein
VWSWSLDNEEALAHWGLLLHWGKENSLCLNHESIVESCQSYLSCAKSKYQRPSWDAVSFSSSREIPTFYSTWRFITAFTTNCPPPLLSLPWTRAINSTTPTHSTSWICIIKSFSHQHLAIPNVLLHQVSSTKTLYTPSFSPIYVICTIQLFLPNWKHGKYLIIGEDNLIISNVSTPRTPSSLAQSVTHSKFIRKVPE